MLLNRNLPLLSYLSAYKVFPPHVRRRYLRAYKAPNKHLFSRLLKKGNNHLYSLPLIPGPQSLTHNPLTNMMIQSKTNNHLSLIIWLEALYNCKETFTDVMKTLQIKLFMQNKANFQKVKLNVNNVLTKDYDQMDTWSIRKNEPKTNPNEPKTNPNSKRPK